MAALKIDPKKLPAPKLPATKAAWKRNQFPAGLPIIEIPKVVPVPVPKPKATWNKGKKQPRAPKTWTPERDRILEEMYKEGASNQEIAEKIGLPQGKVEKRIYARRSKGTLPKLPQRFTRNWTGEEEALLIDLYLSGRSFAEIAEELHKTKAAVEHRAYRFRLQGKLPYRKPRKDKDD